MSRRCEIALSITLVSPFLMQGLSVAALGIDAPALRDGSKSQCPIIPSDQVKGLLRAACVTLADAGVHIDGVKLDKTLIAHLFGGKSDETGNNPTQWGEPQRGAVIFNDLTAPSQRSSSFTRVCIDPETGAAKNGALQTVELVAPLGQRVTFSGIAIARFDAQTMLKPKKLSLEEWLAELLHTAINVIPAVGALKTAGFGRVIKASASCRAEKSGTLGMPNVTAAATDTPPVRERRYVRFDRRLLVDAERVADNVWKGQEIIPGTVFKGALAERLRLAGVDTSEASEYGKALADIRFSHAFPADENGRPVGFALPASLHHYQNSTGTYVACGLSIKGRDALPACAESDHEPAIPRFFPDWKAADRQAIVAATHWPSFKPPPPLPRGHTSIGKDYIAKDQELFVDVGISTNDRRWCLEIGQGTASAPVFAEFMALLDQGLDGIGATGAHATFETAGSAPWDWPSHLDQARSGDGLWAVTLATPALMFRDPRPGMDPVEQYKAYWKDRIDGAELVDVFAWQTLTGGYLGLRRRMYGQDRYYPFVLTQPGSVFLLRGLTETRLEELMRTGLPAQAPSGMAPDVPLTWRTCPYRPENGYGAILVNVIDHKSLAKGLPLSAEVTS